MTAQGDASRVELLGNGGALVGALLVVAAAAWGATQSPPAADLAAAAFFAALAGGLVATVAFGLVVRETVSGAGDVSVTFARNGGVAALMAGVVMMTAVPEVEGLWRPVLFAGGALVLVGAVYLVATSFDPVGDRAELSRSE
ncbi:MAG: hypothetical protein ABEJ40_10930 [Haloarculaceae archaeon]